MRLHEDLDNLFLTFLKIFRYFVSRDKVVHGIEHIGRMGYLVHCGIIFTVIVYIDMDFVHVKAAEVVRLLLYYHCLQFKDHLIPVDVDGELLATRDARVDAQ